MAVPPLWTSTHFSHTRNLDATFDPNTINNSCQSVPTVSRRVQTLIASHRNFCPDSPPVPSSYTQCFQSFPRISGNSPLTPFSAPFLPGSKNLQQLPIVYRFKVKLPNSLWVTRPPLRSPLLASFALSLTLHLEVYCILVQTFPQLFLFPSHIPLPPLTVENLKISLRFQLTSPSAVAWHSLGNLQTGVFPVATLCGFLLFVFLSKDAVNSLRTWIGFYGSLKSQP